MRRKKDAFNKYYYTEHWKKFIYKILEPIDTRCELCGAKRWKTAKNGEKKLNRSFSIHHKNYDHLYNETREDVQVLCNRCHKLCHTLVKMAGKQPFIAELKEVVNKYFTYNGEYDGKRDFKSLENKKD